MATRDIILSINLNRGMDTKSDSRIEAECDLLQNATLDKEYTPRKRNGFELYQDTGKRIKNSGSLNNSVVIESDDGTYSVSKTTNSIKKIGPTFVHIESISPVGQETKQLTTFTKDKNLFIYDFGDYVYSAYSNSNLPGSFIFVNDSNGNDVTESMSWYATLGRSGNISPSHNVTNGVLYSLGLVTGTNLNLDIFNGADSLTQVVVQATVGAISFDVFSSKLNRVFCIYSSGVDITIKEYSNAGVLFLSTTIVAPTDLDTSKKITGFYNESTDEILIVYQKTTGDLVLLVTKYDLSYTRSMTVGSYNIADKYLIDFTVSSSLNNCCVFATYYDKTTISGAVGVFTTNFISSLNLDLSTWNGTFYTSATTSIINGMQLESKAFVYKDINYALCTFERSFNTALGATSYDSKDIAINTSYVLLNKDLEACGHLLKGEARTKFYQAGSFNEPTVIDDNLNNFLIFPILTGDDLYFPVSSEGSILKADISFFNREATKFYEYNKKLILTSALSSFFDGSQLFEIFPYASPYIWKAVADTGGSIANGTYLVCITYVYKTSSGEIFESEKSNIITITLSGANDEIALVVSPPFSNNTNGSYRVYRTIADGIDFSLDPLASTGGSLGAIFLTGNDSTLTDSAYFTGGILENGPPPPSSSSCIYKNRLFFVSAEDSLIYFSKNPEFNSKIAQGFADDLVTGIFDTKQDNIGQVRCVDSQDDKLIIFKNSGVYYLFGDGPDNAGSAGQFSVPQLVNSEVGTSNARSIIQTNLGTMFKSSKGIYILDRSMSVAYIGKEMEAYNDLAVTSAIFKEKRNYAIISLSSGQAMVYDTLNGKWSIFTNYDCSNLCFIQGEIAIFKEDGNIYIENSSYSDAGAFIPFKMIIGWIRLGEPAIQNFQRVKRFIFLGKWKSKHKLKFSMQYDYEDFIEETVTYTPSGTYNISTKPSNELLYTGTNNGVYEVEHCLKKQKCQALKVTIEDVKDSVVGESLELTNLSLIIGMKQGTNKVNNYKKV